MVSERVQRQIDRLLDEAEAAFAQADWALVHARCQQALILDPANADALAFLSAAERGLSVAAGAAARSEPTMPPPTDAPPSSFASGRYTVKRFLGEGGKKKVYLAHDTLLDRDVAFALIKTEGLDEAGRQRIQREAQAMGRLGAHPHIVSVFDLGEEAGGQPFIVTELMGGGDVEGLIEKAPEHRPPLRRTLEIGQAVCRGLAFAHAQQIVHRDLKPGNVWLTADGIAKIGDFGLAVSLDRSRLTQQGMMVGTVAYMPPEQALGGAVTPQADLYSFGAMLYELVTGRPPFLGDDAIAIISQHVNTAPVAPSWHNPAVPPALEGMILRLLAKAPSERPASATEVLAALETIDPDAPVAALSSANPLERLARGVFVGRERELSRLRAAFDDANAGRGGVVMLVGEPGIGKTRTAQELETYVRIRGGQVLWGRAHESAGAPAFWPWVQALRAYVGGIEPQALSTQLGSGAVEVARIVTEVRERLPGLPVPSTELEPEAAQFRLFDAIASFLKNAATATPLLLVLDDLHWADKPSLLLLQHVAREVGRSRLLLVGTYRDVEVGRAHPLAAVLAELQRDALFQRVLLRGLSPEEVEAYIRASANVDPARELLAAISQETEGNPFFLAEVVALLVQEGTLQQPGAARRGTAIAVPQSVREVLGRRLDRLSGECNALLTIAAVAGREFGYDLLAAVSEHDDARLLVLVEEAIEGRVIGETEQAGAYRFSHALVQETLLGELSTTRRVRLHGKVAEALEGLYGERTERHAAELAQHFHESATLTQGHAAKALRYSKLAAEQAEAATAWEEAARHYETCIVLLDAHVRRLDEDEAALRVAAGRCWRNAAEVRPAWRNLMRAVTLYRERSDTMGLARAAVELLDFEFPPEPLAELAAEALTGLNGRDPHLEARVLLRQARWLLPEEGAQALARAQDLADRYGYPDVIGRIRWEQGDLHVRSGRLDLLAHTFDAQAIHAAFVQAGDLVQAARMLRYAGLQASIEGDLDAGEARLKDALTAARAAHARAEAVNCLGQLAGICFLRRDTAQLQMLIDEAGRESWISYLFRAAQAEEDGDFDLALSLLPPERAGGIPQLGADLRAARARIRFSAGDTGGARTEVAAMLDAGRNVPASDSLFAHHMFTFAHLDGALRVLSEEQLREVYDWAVIRHDFRSTTYAARGYDRLRGLLALRLDLADEAETWCRVGSEWAERERCPIEQGRALQGLAEVCERQGQHGEAVRYLDRAAALFQQHGATLYLRQVLAKKEILKA